MNTLSNNPETLTFADLKPGDVVNYTQLIHAVDYDMVIIEQYEDRWGKWTKVLKLDTYEFDEKTSHTQIKNEIQFYRIVKIQDREEETPQETTEDKITTETIIENGNFYEYDPETEVRTEITKQEGAARIVKQRKIWDNGSIKIYQ